MNPNRHAVRRGKLPHEFPIILVIVNLPDNTGYHEGRARIVKACIQTAHERAGAEHRLAIWDNGSAASFEKIAKSFKPDFYIKTENIGKTAATKYFCQMVGKDAIISRTDDDVLFYDGWLAESLKVINAYPRSVVSCSPSRISYHGYASALKFARDYNVQTYEAKHETQWDVEHGASLGYSTETIRRNFLGKAVGMKYRGVPVILGSAHFQLTAPAEAMTHPEFSDTLMRDELAHDDWMDKQGFLRLFTADRYCRHVGNTLSDADAKEFDTMGL